MDFVDILLSRIDGEAELKKPVNALACFARPETGKALSILANYIAKSKSEKSAITMLHLLNQEEARQIDDLNVYQNKFFADIIQKNEKDKITIRAFVKPSDDYVADILKTSEEQKSNLVLVGIGSHVFNPMLWEKYIQLKNDPSNSDSYIQEQFEHGAARSLKNVSTLLARNPVATGVFVDNNFKEVHKIFVPILSKEDLHVFIYVYQIAQKENVKVMVWDAIGIIESNPKVQKFYQFIAKKTDGRIYVWDDDKKIEPGFILQQDLILIGMDSWDKLISSALAWKKTLPSTLIIKDKTT